MEQTPTTSTRKPIENVKVGAVEATIWPNEGANGPYPTFTLSRFYKDPEDNWQRTKTFRAKDAASLQEVARQVGEKLAAMTADEPAAETPKASGRGKAKKAA